MIRSGKVRKARRKAMENNVPVVEAAAELVEVVTIAPEPYRGVGSSSRAISYSGRGADIRTLAKAINEGWAVPPETKNRLLSAIGRRVAQGELTMRELSQAMRAMVAVERLRIEATRLDMLAEVQGLHSAEQTTQDAQSADDAIFSLYDRCRTIEEAELVLRLDGYDVDSIPREAEPITGPRPIEVQIWARIVQVQRVGKKVPLDDDTAVAMSQGAEQR